MAVNVEHAKTVAGWFADSELETLATLAQGRNVIVEIGSWEGRSACAMAANSNATIFCVDAWIEHPQGGFEATLDTFAKFRENTRRYPKVIPIVGESVRVADAMHRVGIFKADMVFIDASHDFDSVSADIRSWWTLINWGGVLCGHDYGDPNWPGVKQAVDMRFGGQVEIKDSIWMVKK